MSFQPDMVTTVNKQRCTYEKKIASNAASQFAYLHYALKVCTLFVKKKYTFESVAE